MPNPTRILCFGRNPVLLHTRHAVLSKRYDVVSVGSLEELGALPSTSAFDILLLCHSLTTQESAAATQIARHRWPGSKILALTCLGSECAEVGADLDLSALDGPVGLLNAIQDLTQDNHPYANPASM